ncbi:MAG: hypothetical protein KJ600_00110 [Nanoarchaeota archaeon]|nr:hypothetical protein [Nanoarchaeota archaeon]MBU1102949.1 hypothetical protein [Nanoarchaeota archaeon]
METIHTYRHIVDVKIVNLFESAIKEVLKKHVPKKLGFLGLVANYDKKEHHDIDLLIFPATDVKIGEVLIELTELYAEIEKELKKEHERYYLATCTKKVMQELVYYLASIEEGAPGLIPVHSLFFPDHRSFKRFNPISFEKEVKKHLIPLYGNFDVIKKVRVLPQEKLEPYFVILDFEMSARIKTFPRHNIRASAESLFCYLKDKYGLNVINKIPYEVKEIEKEFVRLMRILDEKTYN